jgi:hypothetical protein
LREARLVAGEEVCVTVRLRLVTVRVLLAVVLAVWPALKLVVR